MLVFSQFTISAIIFSFGAAIGSFLNVVIFRSLAGEDWVANRSRCDNCKKQIAWFDNVPLLSYLFLGGKCRSCKKPISAYHPFLELLAGSLFLWWYWIGFTFFKIAQAPLNYVQPIFWLLVGLLLIAIFVVDMAHMIIPDVLTAALAAFALVYRLGLVLNGVMRVEDLLYMFLALMLSVGFFWLLWIGTAKKGMGFGDVKLMIPLSLLAGAWHTLVTVFLAFILGGVVGLGLLFFGKKKMKSKVPFGPFMIVGFLLSLYYGDAILAWYFGLLGV